MTAEHERVVCEICLIEVGSSGCQFRIHDQLVILNSFPNKYYSLKKYKKLKKRIFNNKNSRAQLCLFRFLLDS